MLNKVKAALRLTVNNYDDELALMIDAAMADLWLTGINVGDGSDPLILQAVITYCRAHFGSPDDYERIKRSYDEQRAQLISASGYGLHEVGGC